MVAHHWLCPSELPSADVFVIISTQKNPDDIVITLAIRTPLAKGKKGGFKDTDLDYIVYALLKQVLDKSKIDPALVEDICLGNVSFSLLSQTYHQQLAYISLCF